MTKETISRYLENGCKGHKNVVSSRELERALGISGNEQAHQPPAARHCADRSRSAGVLLCGDGGRGLCHHPKP